MMRDFCSKRQLMLMLNLFSFKQSLVQAAMAHDAWFCAPTDLQSLLQAATAHHAHLFRSNAT